MSELVNAYRDVHQSQEQETAATAAATAASYRNMGKIRLTYDWLHMLFGLPSSVQVKNVYLDEARELINIVLQSQDPVRGLTYTRAEGAEIVDTVLDMSEEETDALRRFLDLRRQRFSFADQL